MLGSDPLDVRHLLGLKQRHGGHAGVDQGEVEIGLDLLDAFLQLLDLLGDLTHSTLLPQTPLTNATRL